MARRSRTAFSRRDDGAEVDCIPVEPQTEEDVERNRRMEVLRELLTRIPDEQAETLTLRVVLGWSLPEVAAATGVLATAPFCDAIFARSTVGLFSNTCPDSRLPSFAKPRRCESFRRARNSSCAGVAPTVSASSAAAMRGEADHITGL